MAGPLDVLGDIGSLLTRTVKDVTGLANSFGRDPALHTVEHLVISTFRHWSKGVRYVLAHPSDIQDWATNVETDLGMPFVWTLLTQALGLDLSKAHETLKFPSGKEIANWERRRSSLTVDANKGITALAKLTSFIIAANLAFAALSGAAKMLLAERWESQIDANIGRIGDQLGLNWAMGETLGELMQVLTMRQLEEFANVQVHPNRLDMQVLRMLARQHKLTQEQFWAGLDLQGYPDDLKALILQLDTQQLTPADLQTLWSLGAMSRGAVKTYLEHVGFSDDDVDKLLTIWIDHAETQEVAQFRTTLRADYLDARIGQDQYRDMLSQLLRRPQQVPQLHGETEADYHALTDQQRVVVDMAVASANFAIEHGRTMISVADLQKLYKTGHLHREEYITHLRQLGYSQWSAQQMADVAVVPPGAGRPGLTAAKVLLYAKDGALTSEQAYSKLLALGMPAKDAQFLSLNPDPKVGPWYPPFNVATVRQGYIDGTMSEVEARAALERLRLDPGAIQLELEQAYHLKIHGLDSTPASLRADQVWNAEFRQSIKTVYLAGGIHDMETIDLLMEDGLTQNDAGIIWAAWYRERHGVLPGAPIGPSG